MNGQRICGTYIQWKVCVGVCVCVCVLIARLCPTLCSSMDSSLLGSYVYGIVQVRILK